MPIEQVVWIPPNLDKLEQDAVRVIQEHPEPCQLSFQAANILQLAQSVQILLGTAQSYKEDLDKLRGVQRENRMLRRQLMAHECNCACQETDEDMHAFRCPYRLVMNGIANTLHDGLQEQNR